MPGRTDNEIKNFWHTHLKRNERSTTINNTSTYPLQEAEADSGSGALLDMPQEATSSSSVTGTLLIANDGSSSWRNSPAKGLGFHGNGTVSSDISGKTMGSNAHSEIGEEMEFWCNLFTSSHHDKGMEI